MNDDIARLTEKLDRQRADLAATNLALASIASALTPEQMKHVLTTMAKASAEKQATFEQIPSPAMQSATQLFQESEQRMFALLQGAASRYGQR
jgi:hypothetical protein